MASEKRNPDVEPEDRIPSVSVNQIRAFFEDLVWREAVRCVIEVEIEDANLGLRTSSEILDIKGYQGLLDFADRMRKLPDEMIDLIKTHEGVDDGES